MKISRRPIALAALVVALAASSAPAQSNTPAGPAPGPLRLALMDAILQGLENNRSLRVERHAPEIRKTFEKEQEAVFDPTLQAGLSAQKAKFEQPGKGGVSNAESTVVAGSAGVSKRFATGTRLGVEGSARLLDSSLYSDRFDSTRAGFSLEQALLQGGGTAVNLASLRQARLDTESSEYELRGFVEDLVARIESTYWAYALAKLKIGIVSNSMELAGQQLSDTRERIKVGKTAPVELSAAEAEVATRKAELINARATADKTQLQFLRLLNPQGVVPWLQPIELLDIPRELDGELEEVDAHVRAALRKRPDLDQARLALESGDLELVKTRNGLLPKLDLFVTLGGTGYAESFEGSARDVSDRHYDAAVGVALEYPLGDRAARARHERARVSLEQGREALGNMEQLAEVDVRTAFVELLRARESVGSATVLEKRREETLRAEIGKFQAGKSTSLLVAQAERDLLLAQIYRVEAVVNVLTAFTDLYRLEGTLLDRRGLAIPGPRR